MNTQRRALVLIVVLIGVSAVLLGVLIGCGEKKRVKPPVVGPAGGSGPLGGGETQRIQLTASPSDTLITIGDETGSIRITALIENNIGQPMPDGTPVYWSATIGTIDPTVATSSNGAASATLTFAQSYDGCSHVTARSGDASATIRVCVNNVEATPTPSEIFIVRTNNSVIGTAAGDKATITATALTNGDPDVGLQVNFTVTGPGVLNAGAVLTDASGIASVTLQGTNTTANDQTVTVTATSADGRNGSVQVIVKP